MDDSAMLALSKASNGSSIPPSVGKSHAMEPSKARFMIRTLPKDCNPTPVTALNGNGTQLLSPNARKHPLLAQDKEIHLPENPFDDITEEKLVGVFRLHVILCSYTISGCCRYLFRICLCRSKN